MNTIKIGGKITLAAAALFLLAVIVGTVSIVRINQMNKGVAHITDESLPKLSSLSIMAETANKWTYYAASSLSAESLPAKIEDEAIVTAELAKFDAAVKAYQDHDTSARGHELTAKIVSAHARIYAGWIRAAPLSRAMQNQLANAMWVSELGTAVEDRAKGIEALLAYTNASAKASGTEASSTGYSGLVWGISILCFSVIFGGRLALFIVVEINDLLMFAVAELSEDVSKSVEGAHYPLADGKIPNTVDEIAFQTTILALEAALDAARAREARLGFAATAGEVRSLGQRSTQATEDRAVLIGDSILKSPNGGEKLGEVGTSIDRSKGGSLN